MTASYYITHSMNQIQTVFQQNEAGPHLQTLNWIRFQGLPRDKEGLQHLYLHWAFICIYQIEKLSAQRLRGYLIVVPQQDVWASNAICLLPFHHHLKRNGKVQEYFKANLSPESLQQQANQPCKHLHHLQGPHAPSRTRANSSTLATKIDKKYNTGRIRNQTRDK